MADDAHQVFVLMLMHCEWQYNLVQTPMEYYLTVSAKTKYT